MAEKFVPMVNCGYCAGQTPMCWQLNPKFFDSEEECDSWITEHEDDFSPNEFGGCVYPYQCNDEAIKFYTKQYNIK